MKTFHLMEKGEGGGRSLSDESVSLSDLKLFFSDSFTKDKSIEHREDWCFLLFSDKLLC